MLYNFNSKAVYNFFLDLHRDGKTLILLGDTGQLTDTETFEIFDQLVKEMLATFWDKRYTATNLGQ